MKKIILLGAILAAFAVPLRAQNTTNPPGQRISTPPNLTTNVPGIGTNGITLPIYPILVNVYFGTNAPNGSVTATPGALYNQFNGTNLVTQWVNTGPGTTNWIAVTNSFGFLLTIPNIWSGMQTFNYAGGNGGGFTNITASFFDSIAQALIGGIVQTYLSTSSVSVFLLHHSTGLYQFSTPQAACASAVGGDMVEMLPGNFWLTSQLVLPDNIIWKQDAGSMFYSSNGATVFSNVVADVKVGNNDIVSSFYLTVSNLTNSMQENPLGCGQTDISCTNIELDNIFINGDSDGVVLASTNGPTPTGRGSNWHINAAIEAYKQTVTNAYFVLNGFIFNVTNDSPVLTTSGIIRYGIRDVNGSFIALNGYIKAAEFTASETDFVKNVSSEAINLSTSTPTNIFQIYNVAFDDSLWSGTNGLSCDEYAIRSGAGSAVSTNNYAPNCYRLDGKAPVIFHGTSTSFKEAWNGASYMLNWGSDAAPSLFASPPGGNGSSSTAQTNNTGFSYPNGTSIAVDIQGVRVNLFDAGGENWSSNVFNLTTITNSMRNGDFTIANSNGIALVSVMLTNGTAIIKQLAP